MTIPVIVRNLGLAPYRAVWGAMRDFSLGRSPQSADEVWFVEHPPVYTAGRAALLVPQEVNGIPVVRVERGGDITYHAPGQMVVYPLIDLRRRHLFIKPFVALLLNCLTQTLSDFGIAGFQHAGAPGLYVHMEGGTGAFRQEAKIASIGIHVSRGCTYHGIALNVDMDLSGFKHINPCGYSGLRVTDMQTLAGRPMSLQSVKEDFRSRLLQLLADAAGDTL